MLDDLGSRPMRARGLKQYPFTICPGVIRSRPMRARGLKHAEQIDKLRDKLVAPHAGAWIETEIPSAHWSFMNSRAPCGRVD